MYENLVTKSNIKISETIIVYIFEVEKSFEVEIWNQMIYPQC